MRENRPRPVSLHEPRWAGVREVMGMSGPIILGSMSFTIMDFSDKVMVARVGTDALAAIGSSALWSFVMGTFFLGVVGCVSTFVAQSYGKNDLPNGARYAWQGMYLAIPILLLSLVAWALSRPLFESMNHTEEVTALELVYFRIRLLGYFTFAITTSLAAFFQAVSRPLIPSLISLIACVLNVALCYLLIFGKFGFPEMGIAGAAVATMLSQVAQSALMLAVFLSPSFHARFQTRTHWRFDLQRLRNLVRIGLPSGISFFLDVANWGIFSSFIVGYFGTAQLAAHNVALSIMHISFMPAMAVGQAMSAIVGQWIGRGDHVRAKLRTYTALKITFSYMVLMGIIFAVLGGKLTEMVFTSDPLVVKLGHQLLIVAAFFQAFDGVNMVCMGALRGAGDTRWLMWVCILMGYLVFLPAALLFAFVYPGGVVGAWLGAMVFIISISFLIFRRFASEKWRDINIFTAGPAFPVEVAAGEAASAK